MSDVEIPEVSMIARDKIRPNPWNPNKFDDSMFNELVRSIEEDGFIQPIIIAPLIDDKDGFLFEIVDGEHRFSSLDILEVPEIPCIVRDIDEDKRRELTVKTYRLRGQFDKKKFVELVEHHLEKFDFDEVAERFAFPDPDELTEMIDNARDSLPSREMQEEFDKAKDDIKTVDELSAVLNKLFTKFGDTLPANFMILDFGGKESIWIRMSRSQYRVIANQAREVMAAGYTFDSFLSHLLTVVPIDKTIAAYKDFLEEVRKDGTDIDDLLDEE